MQSGRLLGYCEGDDQVRVDDEKFIPSVKFPTTVITPSNGTGTEDGFNSAWYFSEGVKPLPMNGCLIRQDFGRIDAYRFFLNDAPVFQQSLDTQIEHGGLNDSQGEYYSSVAFWYGNGERTSLAPMPAAATLGFPKITFQGFPNVIEGESLVPKAKATSGTVQVQEMTGLQNVWSGDSQLLWKGGNKPGTCERRPHRTRHRDTSVGDFHAGGHPGRKEWTLQRQRLWARPDRPAACSETQSARALTVTGRIKRRSSSFHPTESRPAPRRTPFPPGE